MSDEISAGETANTNRSGTIVAQPMELGPLVWKGLLLTAITLGIYRFWYRTNLRRWYRTNTIGDGDALAYHGTAKELFIGFLIAVAIFAPLYGAFALAGLVAAGQWFDWTVSIVYAVILFTLAQYGIYRARRYRLTRTSWRGLRFDQVGSPWHYVLLTMGYFALTVVTLGLLYPLQRLKQEAFRIRNTRFGTAEGRFDAPVAPLMKRWIPVYVFLLALSLAMLVGSFGPFLSLVTDNYFTNVSWLGGPAFIPLFLILLAIMGPTLWSWYQAFEFRHFANHTRLGDVQFRSVFPIGSFVKRKLGFIFLVAVMLVTIGLLFGVFMPAFAKLGATVIGVVGMIFGYVAFYVLYAFMKEILLNRRFWELACESMTLENIDTAREVIATAMSLENARGEGFADALDFGGGG